MEAVETEVGGPSRRVGGWALPPWVQASSADLDALVALLTDDVFMSMPPMPFEYTGLYVLTLAGDRISGLTRFDTACSHASGCPDHCRTASRVTYFRR
ncbi:hypothetical protein [Nocardia sp. NPDC004860]|uniref:hypothetical protein n=1 Tax=Nocardia sp. NPDC004860 TaxID=3154557 RepID=UPI0033A98513